MVGGVAGGLSVSFPSFWFLALFSLLPLFLFLKQESQTKRHVFFGGWVFGSALMGTTYYWLFNTLPIDWLGFENSTVGFLIVLFFWSTLSVCIGATVGFFALIGERVLRTGPLGFPLVALVWVLFEYARMWVSAIIMYGPGSILGAHTSSGFLGYALTESELLHLSVFGGVYTLSLAVAVANILFFNFFSQNTKARIVGLIGVTIFLTASVFPIKGEYEAEPPLSIALAHTDFKANIHTSAEEYALQSSELKKELQRIAQQGHAVDVVVLPEDVRLLSRLRQEGVSVSDFLGALFPEQEVLFIDSGRTKTPEGVVNRIYFISSTDGVVGVSDKEFFLPLGEYMPYVYETLFRVLGQGEKIDRLKSKRAYTPTGYRSTVSFHGERLGVLSCSEVLSPTLYKRLVKDEKATVLINLSSLSWFHYGKNPFNQLLSIARVQAVSNQMWYFQATNAGPSVIIDPYGKIRSPQRE